MDHLVEVEHLSHRHPLSRFSHPVKAINAQHDQDPLSCYGCRLPIEEADGSPFYGCKDCQAFLHKSCLDLPLESQNPCHPPHTLTLQSSSGSRRCCGVCGSALPGLAYGCSQCDFHVDVPCHSLAASAEIVARKFEDGGHLFFLVPIESGTQHFCDGCGQFDFDTHVFRCVIRSCPKSFHFRCAPFSLPETVKHDWHFHTLTLMDRYCWEEGYEVYYCDICETERYLHHPVYACKECGFAAHVSCTIFEALPSIIAEYEKGSKSRGVPEPKYDATLGNLSGKIQETLWEEDRLKEEMTRLTERIEKLEATRLQYIASKTSPLAL